MTIMPHGDIRWLPINPPGEKGSTKPASGIIAFKWVILHRSMTGNSSNPQCKCWHTLLVFLGHNCKTTIDFYEPIKRNVLDSQNIVAREAFRLNIRL